MFQLSVEVIYIVKSYIRDIGCFRINIARYCDVNQHQGTLLARLHYLIDHLSRDNGMRRARRSNHNICGCQRGVQVLKGCCLCTPAMSEGMCAFQCAIDDENTIRSALK